MSILVHADEHAGTPAAARLSKAIRRDQAGAAGLGAGAIAAQTSASESRARASVHSVGAVHPDVGWTEAGQRLQGAKAAKHLKIARGKTAAAVALGTGAVGLARHDRKVSKAGDPFGLGMLGISKAVGEGQPIGRRARPLSEPVPPRAHVAAVTVPKIKMNLAAARKGMLASAKVVKGLAAVDDVALAPTKIVGLKNRLTGAGKLAPNAGGATVPPATSKIKASMLSIAGQGGTP